MKMRRCWHVTMEPVFVFVHGGEEWDMQPSGSTRENSAVKGGVVTDSKGDFNLSFVKNHHILQNFKNIG